MDSCSSSEHSFELLDYEKSSVSDHDDLSSIVMVGEEPPRPLSPRPVTPPPRKPLDYNYIVCRKCQMKAPKHEEVHNPFTGRFAKRPERAALRHGSICVDENLTDLELCDNCNLIEYLELENEIMRERIFRLRSDNEQSLRKFATMSTHRDVDNVYKTETTPSPKRSYNTNYTNGGDDLQQHMNEEGRLGKMAKMTETSSFGSGSATHDYDIESMFLPRNSPWALSPASICLHFQYQYENLHRTVGKELDPIYKPSEGPQTVSDLIACGNLLREEHMKLVESADKLAARFKELSLREKSKDSVKTHSCMECKGERYHVDCYVCECSQVFLTKPTSCGPTYWNKYLNRSPNCWKHRAICGYCAYTNHSKLGHKVLDYSRAKTIETDPESFPDVFTSNSIIAQKPFNKQVAHLMCSINNLEREMSKMTISRNWPSPSYRIKKYLTRQLDEKSEYLRNVLKEAPKEAVAELKIPFLCEAVENMKITEKPTEFDQFSPLTIYASNT